GTVVGQLPSSDVSSLELSPNRRFLSVGAHPRRYSEADGALLYSWPDLAPVKFAEEKRPGAVRFAWSPTESLFCLWTHEGRTLYAARPRGPGRVALVKVAAASDPPRVADPGTTGAPPSGAPVFSPGGQFLAVRSVNNAPLWVYRTRDLRPALVLRATPELPG